MTPTSYYKSDLEQCKSDGRSSESTHKTNVVDFLMEKNLFSEVDRNRLCIEVPYSNYYLLRKLLIDNARGTLYIAGETLSDAFSVSYAYSDKSILQNIVHAVNEGRIKNINLYLVDPSVFRDNESVEPPEFVRITVNNVINQLAKPLRNMHCHLNIFFMPYLSIDHAVITDEYMLYRTTKIWTNQRDYKGSVMLYGKDRKGVENPREEHGEYCVHKKYLDTVAENSVHIDTDVNYPMDDSISKDMRIHGEIRNSVKKLREQNNNSIDLYKLYDSQIVRYAVSSFMLDKSRFTFNFNHQIKDREELYLPGTLLNDNSQRVLLPYVKETERLLNEVVKKYDKRSESGAVIIPSLDLGYPNNIMRLAGGFATGMLIDWECGTPIVPIDATVNVCSSSVFKISPDEELLEDFNTNIEKVFHDAVSECGYSFSFKSGNHFLMLATDEKGEYYLVLHSSAKEMKESYFGLYPKENNWYSSKIKPSKENPIYSGKRYMRYIKGDEASYFIQMAHHFEKYNEEIHEWLACRLNNRVKPKTADSIIKHHYYMPTDSSIAIGTFVERPGEVVPLFSNVGKPVYLFKIGEDNWTYKLGGRKCSVCIVPLGW